MGHHLAAGVVVGIRDIHTKLAKVGRILGFVVVAGEHDGVDVAADIEDACHGLGSVVSSRARSGRQ
jgi:hypothetical protein